MFSEIQNLLNGLGAYLGLGEITLDDEGRCSMAFDSVVVNFESEDDGHTLLLYSDVGDPPRPGDANAAFYEELLKANFFNLGTGGGTLGMDRDAGFIALAHRLPAAAITVPQLEGILERFVNLAEAWTRKIQGLLAQNPAMGVESGGGTTVRV